MKILFSPSEAKSSNSPINLNLADELSFKSNYKAREQILQKYAQVLENFNTQELSKLMGLKKESEIKLYKDIDIFNSPLELAILRYTGVGYKYLDFSSLDEEAQEQICENVIIFSNLLGPIKAGDKIPFYKLKQGQNFKDCDLSKHYKEHFSQSLDEFIGDDLLIDLRAGYYEKFYTPKQKRISMKFLKNGKAVSHFAKAYRGLALRALAMHNPKNEDEFRQMFIPDLQIKEILIKGKNTIFIYDIIDWKKDWQC